MRLFTKWLYVGLLSVFLLVLYFFLNSQYFLNLEYIIKDSVAKRAAKDICSRLLPAKGDIVFVNIDEPTLQAYHKTWPMDRKAIALLIRRLRDAKAVVFSVPIEGATGTSGDDALERVLRLQHNVFLPIRFEFVYPPVAGVAAAERAVRLPWRKALPYVFVGAVNFYENPLGEISGFYPIIGYKGQVVSHLVLKALSFLKGFDDRNFVFSKRLRKFQWQLSNGESFSLPVDYKKGIGLNLVPYAMRDNKIDSVSFTEILPVGLYKKYKNRGISVSGYKEADGKIFIVGVTDPSVAQFFSTTAGAMPLHYLLGYSLKALMQGAVVKAVPLAIQYILLTIALGVLLLSFFYFNWVVRFVVLFFEIVCYLVLFYVLLVKYGVFIFVARPIMSLLLFFPVVSFMLAFHRKFLAQKKEIETGIIIEIKERTTLLPPSDLPWIDTRIKEVRASHIAGGMYDFVQMDNKHIGVAVADVFSSGKDALLKISYLRGFLKSQTTITRQPGEVVYSINKALVKNADMNMTCKFLYLLFDAVKNKVVYSGAGGISFIVLGAEGTSVRCFEAEERILLGISREIFYEPRDVDLKKGDTIIIYTPNIFSMKNKHGRSYDIDRLGKLVLANHKLPSGALIERIARDIKAFIGPDNLQDFALIAIKWLNEPVVSDEQNIYVGISPKERDMLLFYKGKKRGSK